MSASSSLPVVSVRAGRVRPVWAGHPWVYAQAVERVAGELAAGDEVLVADPHGKILGRGLYSPSSAIAVRLHSCQADQALDGALLQRRLTRAAALRRAAGLPTRGPALRTNGYRLVYGESDGLPGLIVDVYDDVFAVQLGTCGLARRSALVFDVLEEVFGPRAIVDRTPAGIARAEGFETGTGVVRGKAVEQLSFVERGLQYELPLGLGQKTGYYFDQRPLRERIEQLAEGSFVLDGCCYVASIAMSAARGGARRVVAVDKSAPALAVGQSCVCLNDLADRVELVRENATDALERVAADGGADIVVYDPPKLTASRRGGGSRGLRDKALGAYQRAAARACRATAQGGLLAFCSCSSAVSGEQLTRALALGARQVGRRATVFERLSQGADHPVAAAFPEGLYLNVLLARVSEAS